MEDLETIWQARSRRAAEEASRLAPRATPAPELPWSVKYELYRERVISHYLHWLHLVTGLPYSHLDKSLGSYPTQKMIAAAAPVAKLIWQRQGCPKAPSPVGNSTRDS